mmetsp:Transcript_4725/g.13111  ORF Transcript_4725/g.13111 Transcript_4725/m.13111 type:complete len:313 (-) Transcript_4725:528-1466(-)
MGGAGAALLLAPLGGCPRGQRPALAEKPHAAHYHVQQVIRVPVDHAELPRRVKLELPAQQKVAQHGPSSLHLHPGADGPADAAEGGVAGVVPAAPAAGVTQKRLREPSLIKLHGLTVQRSPVLDAAPQLPPLDGAVVAHDLHPVPRRFDSVVHHSEDGFGGRPRAGKAHVIKQHLARRLIGGVLRRATRPVCAWGGHREEEVHHRTGDWAGAERGVACHKRLELPVASDGADGARHLQVLQQPGVEITGLMPIFQFHFPRRGARHQRVVEDGVKAGGRLWGAGNDAGVSHSLQFGVGEGQHAPCGLNVGRPS